MAEQRMFAKTIIDSDAFLDMLLSGQALYSHLTMRTDDGGFINSPGKLQRMVGREEDDLELLMVKEFILVFENGVIVIEHWEIHDYTRSDRYKPTLYQEEKDQIIERNSEAYTFEAESSVNDQLADYQRLPQESIVQSKLGQSQGSNSENDCLKMIYRFYGENGSGTLASKTNQDFKYQLQDFMQKEANQEETYRLTLHALGIAIDRNKRNYGYVNAILGSWGQRNYLSVHKVLVNDKKQVSEHAPQMTEGYQELGL